MISLGIAGLAVAPVPQGSPSAAASEGATEFTPLLGALRSDLTFSLCNYKVDRLKAEGF